MHVPDHLRLLKTRNRLRHEVRTKLFGFALKVVAGRGLLKGGRICVEGSIIEANDSLWRSYAATLARPVERCKVA
ncbi:MAG: hypothetical protein ACREC0_01490 [Methylocella sp.]